jgi:hypothetical protein
MLRNKFKEIKNKNKRMSSTSNTEPKSVRARRMITEVETALATQTPAQVSSNFAEYQREFPKIFEMLLTRTYRRDFLEMMLGQLERVERGSTSQHNASVAVGTLLVDEIVKPQLRAAGKQC